MDEAGAGFDIEKTPCSLSRQLASSNSSAFTATRQIEFFWAETSAANVMPESSATGELTITRSYLFSRISRFAAAMLAAFFIGVHLYSGRRGTMASENFSDEDTMSTL